MAEVVFLPAAQTDYEEALAWYQARSARTAEGFESAVANGIQRIADQPELYALVDDRHRFCLLRRYPYSLVYRAEHTAVVVVAVPHSRRSTKYWQGR